MEPSCSRDIHEDLGGGGPFDEEQANIQVCKLKGRQKVPLKVQIFGWLILRRRLLTHWQIVICVSPFTQVIRASQRILLLDVTPQTRHFGPLIKA